MTTPVPSRVWLLASRLLACVETAFSNAGVALPTRRIVYGGGDVPADPDSPDTIPGLLAVGLVSIQQGLPGLQAAGGMQPPAIILSATLQVQLIRPASMITQNLILPSDETMSIDGMTFTQDAQILSDAFILARTTAAVPGQGLPVALGGISPLPVQGGESGTTMDVAMPMSGPLV